MRSTIFMSFFFFRLLLLFAWITSFTEEAFFPLLSLLGNGTRHIYNCVVLHLFTAYNEAYSTWLANRRSCP